MSVAKNSPPPTSDPTTGPESTASSAENHLLGRTELPYLSQLTLGLLHKFNNLITGVIFTNEECLQSVPEGQPLRASLESVGTNLREALTFIDRVVRLHVNEQDDDVSFYDLNALVEDQLVLLRLLLPKGTPIHFQPAPDGALFYGSRRAVQEILLHLAGNAGNFIALPFGALWIAVSEKREGGTTTSVITVRDNGPGFAPEILPRLFQPFVTSRAAVGAPGLGLYRAHRLAESLNGTLTARNVQEGGAEFTLTLAQGSSDPGEGGE